MTHPLDIPDFLRRTPERQAEINASWKGKRCPSVSGAGGSVTKLKVEDASTRAFRRELEKQRKAKMAERFAMLRERAALTKKQKVK